MKRRTLISASAGLTIGMLAGCLSDEPSEQADTETDSENEEPAYDVGMTATAYVPETITIEPGETVVWKNTSSRRHTVTASSQSALPEDAEFFASGGYDSYEEAEDAWLDEFGGQIDTDETYSHTFEIPGSYSYVCIPHVDGGMTGTVVVE